MQSLLAKAKIAPKIIEEGGEENQVESKKGKVVKFGWLDGVFMRCLLNIWGVMLFLRLTWVVGQGGLIQGLLVILLCNVVTTVTAISMSAVCTNGQIKGGGIYFMISRSLGPEFGGAIGIMFTVANSIAVSMYIIGFCEALFDMLKLDDIGMTGITGIGFGLNDTRLIGCVTLVALGVLAVVGMDWVTRVQIGLLGLLIVSQIDFVIGAFLPAESEKKFGFTGFSTVNFAENLWSDYQQPIYNDSGAKIGSERGLDRDFFSLFSVFFPAVTGIVAGANLSGDLKDPATAIPKGTLLAIATTFVTYIGYGLMIGGVAVNQASGNELEYNATIARNLSMYTQVDFDKFNISYAPVNNTLLAFDDCTPQAQEIRICEYGTGNDQQMMAKISGSGYLIFAGCFAATLSSAIASLVGAPRVLQALGKDKLYPYMEFFSKGYGANQDPFRGYLLVFLISMGCILIGDLNAVSGLLSNFFVAAYALINFSVFHASITKSPGWRPSFKYYSPWMSLIGTFLCVAVMFLMDWATALITFAIVSVLYMYISYRKPEANWGSSTQAQQFVTTLKNCHTLNEMPEHVKNYRPKILVFSGVPAHRQPLVDFANLITKKLSLLICAHVEENAQFTYVEAVKESTGLWLKDHNVKCFFNVVPSPDFETGAVSIMDACGLGKLVPNMILLGYKNNWMTDLENVSGYINVLHHGFDVHLSVGILRLQDGCDYSALISKEEQIIIPENAGDTEAEIEKEKANKDDNSDDVEQEEVVIVTTSDNVVEKKKRTRTTSVAVFHGVDGNPLERQVVENITQFQAKKRKGNIDVWWLYDDGGLTLLLPYILTTRAQFSDCSLRVFSLANRSNELDRETRNMASLLAKFRIDYSDVIVIPDVTKKAGQEIKTEFKTIIDKINVAEEDFLANKEKTNRNLRLAELLREHSTDSEMVIMTLPMPRKGAAPPNLYMSWLEIMTRKMPPFLLVRGNQTSVLTFYS